jgi:hypothetical protein
MQILEYLDGSGKKPFASWFDRLDAQAAAKITVALSRIGLGNLSNAKSIDGALLSIGSILGPDIESILVVMETKSSSAAEQRSASSRT